MKSKQYWLLLILLCNEGFAENTMMDVVQKNRMGDVSYTTSSADEVQVTREHKGKRYYEDEVILNHLLEKDRMEVANKKGKGRYGQLGFAYNNIMVNLAKQKENSNTTQIKSNSKNDNLKDNNSQAQSASTKPPVNDKYFFTGGYCRLLAPLKVSTLAQYASFSCDLEGSSEKVRLTALIQPEHISKALIAKPLYIKTYDGHRFEVKNGVMMNYSQTSINLASRVNDYAIERMIAKGSLDTAKIASNYAKEYLNAKLESQVTQTYHPIDGNLSNPFYQRSGVVTTNRATPKKRDYVNMAGIEMVSSLIQTLGQAWVEHLDYLYTMDADTVYYADLMISTKESMVGIKYDINNLVKKSPSGFGNFGSSNRSQTPGVIRLKESSAEKFFNRETVSSPQNSYIDLENKKIIKK